MNYTLESFIDFCDTMEIAEEGFFFKKKNKNKLSSQQSKPKENSPKNWWESGFFWEDDGNHTDQYDVCIQDLKNCKIGEHGFLFYVLRAKKITRQQFDILVKKRMTNSECIKYTNYCLMNSDFVAPTEYAKKVAKELMLVMVDVNPDNDGYLLYSIRKGMFYNFISDSDSGENIDEWIANGVKYEEVIK